MTKLSIAIACILSLGLLATLSYTHTRSALYVACSPEFPAPTYPAGFRPLKTLDIPASQSNPPMSIVSDELNITVKTGVSFEEIKLLVCSLDGYIAGRNSEPNEWQIRFPSVTTFAELDNLRSHYSELPQVDVVTFTSLISTTSI